MKQKIWGYDEALTDFGRGTRNLSKVGLTPEQAAQMGVVGEGATGNGRSWNDILLANAYQTLGQGATKMTPQQLEAHARQHGILGAKETSWGEDIMEGLSGPLLIPAAFTGAGLYTGAFGGAGAAGMSEAAMMNPALAGGGEIGSGYAASAALPEYAGGYMLPGGAMPSAITPVDPTFGGALMPTGPGTWGLPAGGAGAAGLSMGGAEAGVAGASAGSPSVTPSASSGASGAGTAAGVGGAATTGVGGLLSNPSVLGAAGGALLGGMGGGETKTITTESGLPDWLQPYVKPALDKYSAMIQNYNTDPYGVMPAAMQQYKDTVSGMYLDPSTNKYLQDYYNAGAERVKGTLSPSFGHMQAFGQHSGYNEALAGGLSDLATGIYGGAYERERDRQAQMVAQAPNFIGTSSNAAFAPYSQYISAISGLGKKQQQPYFDNPMGSMLGGAMVGSQLGKSIFG